MAKNIPDGITAEDVLDAIAAFTAGSVQHNFHESEKYDLLHQGERYPPKAILGIAARRSAGHVLEPSDFSGGEGSSCFRVLRRCGFDVVLKPNTQQAPKTYLYTWNPGKWEWKDFKEAAATVRAGNRHKMYWSCGHTKSIAKGDYFLLVRLGVEPKGILGCGIVTSTPYALPHWDADLRAKGKEALRTDLEFTSLSDHPIITLQELERRYPGMVWTPQISGVSVGEEIAKEVLSILEGNAAETGQDPSTFEQTVRRLRMAPIGEKPEGQKSPERVTRSVEQFQRDLRVKACVLEKANGKCELCGRIAPFVDDAGFPFLEVHHVVPLADRGEDTVSNAVALCPNCHRRCHHSADRKKAATQLSRAVLKRNW